METFKNILQDHHKCAQDWKAKTGGKLFGYFCHYFPEELVYAAGVLPVRILGKRDADGISQRYLYGHFCRASLDILAEGLKGNYSYLDGIGHAECCLSKRGSYASYRIHVPHDYEHFVSVPSYVDNPGARKFLRAELSAFKKDLEKWTEKPITDDSLDRAIEVYNENRSLLQKVYHLRRADNPPISGTEAFEMILSSQVMDKAEHSRLVKDTLDKLSGNQTGNNTGPRIMLLGSDISDTSLIEFIESMGATVVIDGLCNGMNYVWTNIVTQEDRLLSIAQRYLDKPRCPVKDNRFRRRPAHLAGLALDYNVDGVIYAIQKFCHPHQFDRPPIMKILQERYIPVHEIEYDGTLPLGEYQARLETFLETLKKSVPV